MMAKYGSMVDRLTAQMAAKGVPNARVEAIMHLRNSGVLDAAGRLTAKGRSRTAMGPAGRAKDRAARQTGRAKSEYAYDPHTNRATLK
jgi:hypothetical protein